MDQLVQQLGITQVPMAPIGVLVVNLLIGFVLSAVLAWHYVKFGQTYSNRRELAQVFPLVVLATVLIISLVQSNVALSLGMVGALSIVRFRTPIKEPEELSYLFLAIAIGLGLGASQRLATILATALILTIVTARSATLTQRAARNLYLNVELPQQDGEVTQFRTIDSLLAVNADSAEVRRLDVRDGVLQATYFVDCADSERLIALMDELRRGLPDADISFVEQRGIPGL
ncbi:MAG: DUF4956 domain-containing protein [Anaerolineae bacterium]